MGRRKGSTAFPVARIKKMMQSDDDVGKIATVTPMLVAKALECMMELVVTQAAQVAIDRRSRTVTPLHLKSCVMHNEDFDFLRPVFDSVDGVLDMTETESEKIRRPRRRKSEEVEIDDGEADGEIRKKIDQLPPLVEMTKKSNEGVRSKLGKLPPLDKMKSSRSNKKQSSGLNSPKNRMKRPRSTTSSERPTRIQRVARIESEEEQKSELQGESEDKKKSSSRPNFVNDDEEDYDDEDDNEDEDTHAHAQNSKEEEEEVEDVQDVQEERETERREEEERQVVERDEAKSAHEHSLKTAGRVSVHALLS